MRAMLMIFVLLLPAICLANPVLDPFIWEVSTNPPYVVVMPYYNDSLVGEFIITREGSAEILSAEVNDYGVVILDSSNTTGFYLNPDGDSISFSLDRYYCDKIGYGTYGKYAGAPPPGGSIVANTYGSGNNRWHFDFCLDPADTTSFCYYSSHPSWGWYGLIINEISIACDWRGDADFIELFNGRNRLVYCDSMKLIGPVVYTFPEGLILRPNEFFVINKNDCPGLFDMSDGDNLYLTHRKGSVEDEIYTIVDQVGWSSQFEANTSFMRYPDGDVRWNYEEDFLGYNTETSTTFEPGFPTRGAANRHDCPGLVVIAAKADSLDEGIVRITWTDPIWDDQFEYSVLVRSTGGYVTNPDDGDIVYEGTDQIFIDELLSPEIIYYYTIFARTLSGEYSTPTSESQTNTIFPGMGVREDNLPSRIDYLSCYPNPFNAQTKISFSLASAGEIELTIYDITGRLIETITNDYYTAGRHSVNWNAGEYSSGVYFVKLSTNYINKTDKLVLLK